MSGTEPAPPKTPRIVLVAIGLLVFAAAAPFIGSFIQDRSPDGQNVMLGDFFVWTLAGLAAGGFGLACAVIGALRRPRSALTIGAAVLAVLLVIAVVTFGVLLFH
jgi:hypothetical protein